MCMYVCIGICIQSYINWVVCVCRYVLLSLCMTIHLDICSQCVYILHLVKK